MSEDNSRKENKEKILELERTVKALVKAIKEIESELDEPMMPEGSYFGIEFKD